MKCCVILAALSVGLLVSEGCKPTGKSGQPRLAYVTNGIASFWVIAEKGALDAGKKYDVEVLVRKPPEEADQRRMVEDLVAMGVDGIAISPIDPDNQQDLLNEAAAATNLITQDADAPDCNRICYVGTDNYTAGRLCGELIKAALPDGGDIMIFVGRLGQLNARQRRQGIIDELLDRTADPKRFDAPGDVLRGRNYVILDTRTDQFDFAKAKALAEDAITRFPELDAMVGLFAYNPPKCLEAVKEAGKVGRIQIIGFDEADETLRGIHDGEIYGTVVQNPYRYGVESVRILAGLARGDRTVLPDGGFLNIPTRKITRANVDAFWDELKKLTAAGGA